MKSFVSLALGSPLSSAIERRAGGSKRHSSRLGARIFVWQPLCVVITEAKGRVFPPRKGWGAASRVPTVMVPYTSFRVGHTGSLAQPRSFH